MEDFVHESNMEYVASHSLTLGYLAFLMVSGLVGNTLVFLVYYKRFKPGVTRTYILAMSVCDLLSNSLALPSDIYEIRFHYDFDDDPGCKFFGYITRLLALSGAFILIAIAVDRRRSICQAAKTPRRLTHVYIELVALGVFASLYAIPFGILRGLQTIPIGSSNTTGTNTTGTTCSIADEYVGSLLFTIYNGSTGLTFIICVTTMAVCYALIGRHLWLHKRRLRRNAKDRQKPGSDKHSNKAQPQPDKGGEGERGIKLTMFRSTKQSQKNSTHAGERSEDEEGKATPGKLQISMTDDSDGIISDSDNTTSSYNPQTSGTMSSTLTNLSDTETSSQADPESCSGDGSTEDANGATPGRAGTEKAKPKPAGKKLREAAMVANASKSHTTSSSGTAHKAKAPKGKKHGGKKPASAKKVPSRTTLMMFILAAMYVVSYLPYLATAAYFKGKDLSGASYWVKNLHQICLRSFFINSAINPFVYSFCSVKFRSECYHFLCRK